MSGGDDVDVPMPDVSALQPLSDDESEEEVHEEEVVLREDGKTANGEDESEGHESSSEENEVEEEEKKELLHMNMVGFASRVKGVMSADRDANASKVSKNAKYVAIAAELFIKQLTEATMALKGASAWKDEGNQAFKKKDFKEALTCYEEALARCATEAEESVVHNNIAAVRIQEGNCCKAILSCNDSLSKQKSAKAYYRKGQALSMLVKNKKYQSEVLPVLVFTAHIDEATTMRSVNEFELLLCAQACFKKSLSLSETDNGTTKLINEVRRSIFRSATRDGVEIAYTKTHAVGMVAVRNLEQGETVLKEKPTCFTKETHWQLAGKDIVKQCMKLDSSTQEWVSGLHDPSGGSRLGEERFFCVWDANGHAVGEIDFRVGEKGKSGSALYLSGSRINHSCTPNAVQSFCHETGTIRIRTLKTIKAGDEVTITYCPLHMDAASRHAKLRFECACERCKVTKPKKGENKEREAIEKRFEAISDLNSESDPNVRDNAAVLAAQLEEDAVRVLGEDDEATFMVTLLRCKLWAERQGVLDSLVKLHSYIIRHMPANWPLLVSTNMYLAVHKSNNASYSDEEVLKHINQAFRIHSTSLGESFDDSKDKIAYFWSRYETELTALTINSLERANMLLARA